MAKGKKTGGKDFEPGQSGNPSGRPPDPECLKLVRKMRRKYVEERVLELYWKTEKQLREILGDMSLPMAERHIVQVILTGFKESNLKVFEFINDFIFGERPQRVELTGEDGGPIETAVLTREERRKKLDELIARRDRLLGK